MSWISGPCVDGHDEAFEVERNVTPERDDEEMPRRRPAMGATHFPTMLWVNQRDYPGRSRGPVRDSAE